MHRRFCLAVPLLIVLAACEEVVAPLTLMDSPCGEIVPGAYLVGFTPLVVDVSGRARELLAKYGGTLTYVWESDVPGFAATNLTEAAALAIVKEPGIAYVDPDRIVCTGAP